MSPASALLTAPTGSTLGPHALELLRSGAPGALAGLLLGVGACLLLAGAPPLRRPSLVDRLAPHVRETARSSRLLAGTAPSPLRAVPALLVPVVEDLTQVFSRALAAVSGTNAAVRRRLDRAGSSATVEHFRVEQVLWAAAGLAAGVAVAAAIAVRSSSPLLPGLAAVAVGLGGGVVARDRALAGAVTRRERRIMAELPTIAELLALSVSAGEGAVGALERVARSSSGELAGELRRTLAQTRAGAPLVTALEAMAARTGLPSLARFTDGVVVAVERGTPLAEVLRAQAQDVREESRRSLMEAGGRKEIAMMVPVVFLVLPITILFAVYPGFAALRVSP